AVKPSTGEVLAVANQAPGEFNAAFQGGTAPGSVMKILTAAALIDNGVTSANGSAPCPDAAVALSQTFHNLKGMRPNEKATLADSFARSCNTAFIKLSDDLGPAKFAAEAEDRFGIGKDWKTGIVSRDGSDQLRQMMRLTATNGTAAAAMAGVPGDKGAKTGSAEVDGQGNANSWFTGYS